MRNTLIVLTLFTLMSMGCSVLRGPGYVSTDVSDYDQTIQVSVEPGWANKPFENGTMMIGAFKSSKMPTDDLVLVVRNMAIEHFSTNHPNLFIMIDGSETKLTPTNNSTECEIASGSSRAYCFQHYLIKKNFLKKMLSAKKVVFKLYLRTNTYILGYLDGEGPTTAKKGLEDFLSEIEKSINK